MILGSFIKALDLFECQIPVYITEVIENNQWVSGGSNLDRFVDEELSENIYINNYLKEWLPLRLNFIKNCFSETFKNVDEIKIARRLIIDKNKLEDLKVLVNSGIVNTNDIGLHFAEYGLECAWNYYGDYKDVVELNICLHLREDNLYIIDFENTIRNRIDWENGDDEQEITLKKNETLRGLYLEIIKEY